MAHSSQRERITQYIQDTYGTEAEYLWADSPGNAIFRHSASKKWYAAMMRVLPEKLGLTGEEACSDSGEIGPICWANRVRRSASMKMPRSREAVCILPTKKVVFQMTKEIG